MTQNTRPAAYLFTLGLAEAYRSSPSQQVSGS